MTTFLDDGLVEECLEDNASLVDFDECQIINLDDINAIIEDPGYILEEPLSTGSKIEKYGCSYGKRSFTLPVTFFDISRNVKLLTKCRPISIKIVDCRIYPWYYRKAKREKTEKCFSIKDEETNGETLNIDTDDLIIIHSDNASKLSSHLSDQSNVPKIDLSSEQSQVISNLKQDIERISDIEKTYKNTNFSVNIDKDSTKIECNANEAVVRNISDKAIEDSDLLKYKAIAETIVRNVDILEPGDVQFIKEPEVYRESTFNKCIAAVNEKPMNVTPNKNDKPEKIKDRITTSPRKIRSQKKTPTRRNNSKKPKKVTVNKQNLETCSNLSKSCDTSSTTKVIPHSHYRLPTPTDTAANHVYYMNLDRMISQYYATQRYLEQTQAGHAQYAHHQPISQVNYVTGSNSNFVCGHYGNRFTAPLNSSEGHYFMNYRPTSGYEYNNTIYNMPQYENQQVIIKSNVEKRTPPKPVHESPYGYINTINNSERQVITENQNKVDVREKNVCRNNYRLISGHPSNNASLFPHSMHPSNSYVNSTSLQVPKHVTEANIYNNPVLSQLLTKPIKPPNNYLSTQLFSKASSVTRPSVIQNTSGIIIHNDNNNTHSQIQPVHFNSLSSAMEVNGNCNNEKINKNVEKVKKSKVPRPNKKGEINRKSNSILNAPYNTAYTVYSGANLNPAYNTVNDTRRLNDRLATSSQIFRENISELTKTINFGQEIDRSKVGPVKGERDVNAKISGYSPAILPIPTFKKSLQILSEIQKHNQIDATNEKNNFNYKNDNTSFIHGESKVGRKRQHINDSNTYTKSKKISLQEYKLRILEAEKADTKTDDKKEIDCTESLKRVDIQMQEEGCQNVDTQDLGYDSDCTVVLDILN